MKQGLGGRIKPGGRLVHEQKLGFHKKHPGQGQSLGHAAGKRPGGLQGKPLESHPFQQGEEPGIVQALAVDPVPELEIPEGRQGRIHEGLVPHEGHGPVRDPALNRSRPRLQKAGHDLQKRRLARTIGASHEHDAARRQDAGDAFEDQPRTEEMADPPQIENIPGFHQTRSILLQHRNAIRQHRVPPIQIQFTRGFRLIFRLTAPSSLKPSSVE